MKNWTPQIRQQIESTRLSLALALTNAYIAKHGLCVIVKQEVKPTEFDSECRWWMEPATEADIAIDAQLQELQKNLETIKQTSHFQADVMRYHSMTTLPPEKAMLVQTIDGDAIEMTFMPKVKQPQSTKPKGFGK